jgi:tRNA1(Val) A37 N6-methylase TrmN6
LKQELVPIIGSKLHLDYTTETRPDHSDQIDAVFKTGDDRIVLEVEVGSHRKLLEGIEQADRYRETLAASGTITIVYPEEARREVETRSDILQILYDLPFESLVLTPFQRKYHPEILLNTFLDSLESALRQPQPTDLDTLIQVLRECVDHISFQAKRSKLIRSSVAQAVVSEIATFTALAGPEEDVDEETLESAAADLASYVIVNQILLYFLLSPTLKLTRLRGIESTEDLSVVFKRVTDVNYKAVYRIEVVKRLPKTAVPDLNRIITAFKTIKPEAVPYDLLGRMFHEFLPLTTRKLFATFYTKPIAAELLAHLAINEPEYVLEPSVGSGTILVAVYKTLRKKLHLTHNEALRMLFALDIMPFAAHLAAVNLTLQDLKEKTQLVNVGIGNSLNIRPSAMVPTQIHLFDPKVTKRADAEKSVDEELKLPSHVDLVIMNPPFTDSRRYTLTMLGLREQVFRERQNYWAYFLSFADDMLGPNGRIAAVLPRLFFTGSKSKEVRDWLFADRKYSLRYVIRTTIPLGQYTRNSHLAKPQLSEIS